MKLIFDLEADHLLDEVTKVWCIVAKDFENNKVYTFDPDKIQQGLDLLAKAELLVGHNIIVYDLPVIEKIYPWFKKPYVIDTLLLSRLYHPDLLETDKRRHWEQMPLQL